MPINMKGFSYEHMKIRVMRIARITAYFHMLNLFPAIHDFCRLLSLSPAYVIWYNMDPDQPASLGFIVCRVHSVSFCDETSHECI